MIETLLLCAACLAAKHAERGRLITAHSPSPSERRLGLEWIAAAVGTIAFTWTAAVGTP